MGEIFLFFSRFDGYMRSIYITAKIEWTMFQLHENNGKIVSFFFFGYVSHVGLCVWVAVYKHLCRTRFVRYTRYSYAQMDWCFKYTVNLLFNYELTGMYYNQHHCHTHIIKAIAMMVSRSCINTQAYTYIRIRAGLPLRESWALDFGFSCNDGDNDDHDDAKCMYVS